MARKNYDPKEDYGKPFPTRLRKLMEEKGVTQEEVGAAIGKLRQTVSCYINGSSLPDSDTIIELAKYFSVPTDYLLGLPYSVASLDIDVQKICNRLGISEEAADSIMYIALSPMGAKVLNATLTSPHFYNLILDLCQLDNACVNAVLLYPKIFPPGFLNVRSEVQNSKPSTNLQQYKDKIRAYIGEIYELTQNLADEVTGFRGVRKILDSEIEKQIRSHIESVRKLDALSSSKSNSDKKEG